MHRFEIDKSGQLAHFSDDTLRATIPPVGWDEYVVHWPAAAEVVKAARSAARTRAPAAAANSDPAPKPPKPPKSKKS